MIYALQMQIYNNIIINMHSCNMFVYVSTTLCNQVGVCVHTCIQDVLACIYTNIIKFNERI